MGNWEVGLKVPKEEASMPLFSAKVKVATMDANGHVIWPAVFEKRTATALRKQMKYHLKEMINNPEYPTLTQMTPGLTSQSESVRQYPERPQPTARLQASSASASAL